MSSRHMGRRVASWACEGRWTIPWQRLSWVPERSDGRGSPLGSPVPQRICPIYRQSCPIWAQSCPVWGQSRLPGGLAALGARWASWHTHWESGDTGRKWRQQGEGTLALMALGAGLLAACRSAFRHLFQKKEPRGRGPSREIRRHCRKECAPAGGGAGGSILSLVQSSVFTSDSGVRGSWAGLQPVQVFGPNMLQPRVSVFKQIWSPCPNKLGLL